MSRNFWGLKTVTFGYVKHSGNYYNRDGECLLRGTDWVSKYEQVSAGL